MIRRNPLRTALWALLASLGLVVLTAIWSPEPTRARVMATNQDPRGQRAADASDAALSEFASTSPNSRKKAAASASTRDTATHDAPAADGFQAQFLPLQEPEQQSPRTAASAVTATTSVRSARTTGARVELGPSIATVDSRDAQQGPANSGGQNREFIADSSPGPANGPTERQLFQAKAVSLDPSLGTERMSPFESRLAGLQQQVERLAQANTQQQNEKLERTVQLLLQIQQTQQTKLLDDLEKQVLQLKAPQNGAASHPTGSGLASQPKAATAPQPGAAAAPAERDNAPAEPPRGESSQQAKTPILKAEPTSGNSETFSLQIQDAEITQVLDMVGQLAGLNILAGQDVKGKVTANLQDVTVDRALQAILRSLGYVFEHEGDFIYVMTPAEAESRKQKNRKIITKVYHPHYISVVDLKDLVTPLLTPAPIGKIAITNPSEVGIQADTQNVGGNKLAQNDAVLVQDYAEVISEVDGVFAEMDTAPLQVVIEAMILSVKLTDEMRLGVNFALLNGQSNSLLVSGNGQQLNNSSGIPGGGTSIVPAAGDFIADTAGLKYGFLRGDASLFVEAIERIADTNVVAAPQLRVLNKQRAQLTIGKRLSYKTLAFQDNQTIESVNFLETGTRLILRPFIAPDGLIRMEVHPERSSGTINESTGLPDVDTTEVTTNVMVPDGSTVVIGGLIVEETKDEVGRVPILGAIPVVGNLFRNKVESVNRDEIIVLITPRIVSDPQEDMAGATVRAEGEQRARYFRDQLTPINRHNLARLCYERAVKNYECGDLFEARHWVRKALYHNPSDIEALRLRDQVELQLRGKREKFFKLPFMSDKSLATARPPVATTAPDEAELQLVPEADPTNGGK